MAERRGRDVTIGTMFALALVIMALGVMAVGGDGGLFFRKRAYLIRFPETDGLLVGAPVKMAGVQIGTVTGIRLPTDPTLNGIEVQIGVQPAYAPRIRQDSSAALRILQLLTSEKFVEILSGSPDSPVLEPGSEIPQQIEIGVFERGEAVAESLGDITVSLKNILAPLERGEGLIGRMIQDPAFGTEAIESAVGTLDNLQALTNDLRHGQGAVGRLLRDEELAGSLDRIASAAEEFSVTLEAIGRREGVVGELLDEDGAGQQAARNLRDASASLKELLARIEQDRGLVGRLLNDEAYSEQLATDLQTTLGNLAAVTSRLERGEGTLGQLISDPTLHDGLDEVVSGIHDSKFARWLLRHYRKKGIKAEAKDEGS